MISTVMGCLSNLEINASRVAYSGVPKGFPLSLKVETFHTNSFQRPGAYEYYSTVYINLVKLL